jgi:hypothetical protein
MEKNHTLQLQLGVEKLSSDRDGKVLIQHLYVVRRMYIQGRAWGGQDRTSEQSRGSRNGSQ